jgi:hypothetical protein
MEQAECLPFVRKFLGQEARATQNFNTEDPPLSGIGTLCGERRSTIFQ